MPERSQPTPPQTGDAARFDRPLAEGTRRSCIVIVELFDEEALHDIGIVVDAVSAVIDRSRTTRSRSQ